MFALGTLGSSMFYDVGEQHVGQQSTGESNLQKQSNYCQCRSVLSQVSIRFHFDDTIVARECSP